MDAGHLSMICMLAKAEPALLLSLYKPAVMLVVLAIWARLVSRAERDMDYYMLPKWVWGPVLLGTAVFAYWIWLFVPLFWLGLPMALLILAGSFVAYTTFRNPKVPATARWRLSFDRVRQMIGDYQHQQIQKNAAIYFLAPDGTRIEVPNPTTTAGEAHGRFEELAGFALPRGADRIDIAVTAQQAGIRVRVDGFDYPQPRIEPKPAMALVNYIKTNARLNVEDLRNKQHGEVNIDTIDHGRHQLVVATSGSPSELVLSIYIDPRKLTARPLSQLGLLPSQLRVLEPVLNESDGVVLIACPPEEGMTTSLYTLLHSHDPYTQNVITLEDDIAYQVEGVEHQTVDAGTDNMSFARRLSAALRRTPQVALIGRPLSPEIAKAMTPEAGNVRFYAGLHQTDAFRGLVAWIKMIGDPREAADALSAVVAQRLARKLCTTCRVPYKPDAEALRKMNLQPERVGQLYKHSGRITVNNKQEPCPDCAGMGYRGRFAMYEVIVLDDEARKLVAASQIDQLRIYLRKTQKMVWLQEAALVKVVDQTTSISEANRVLSGQKAAAPGRSAAGKTSPGRTSVGESRAGSSTAAPSLPPQASPRSTSADGDARPDASS